MTCPLLVQIYYANFFVLFCFTSYGLGYPLLIFSSLYVPMKLYLSRQQASRDCFGQFVLSQRNPLTPLFLSPLRFRHSNARFPFSILIVHPTVTRNALHTASADVPLTNHSDPFHPLTFSLVSVSQSGSNVLEYI